MSPRVSVSDSQRKLAAVWFVLCGVLIVAMIVQTFSGRFGGQIKPAWSWFLPNIMPTLSLIVAVLVAEAVRTEAQEATVNRFLFRLTWGASLAYLLVVFSVVVLHPLSGLSPIELMDVSIVFMGPTQGLVAGLLGAFFVSKQT